MKSPRNWLLVTLFVYVIWYLLPQVEWRWMTEDAIVLVSYSGLESILELDIWQVWVMFGFTLLIFIGAWLFGGNWRYAFVGYFALQFLVLTPLAGMVAETALSIALRDASNVLIGITSAILFMQKADSPTMIGGDA
jgi:hypothetical protein